MTAVILHGTAAALFVLFVCAMFGLTVWFAVDLVREWVDPKVEAWLWRRQGFSGPMEPCPRCGGNATVCPVCDGDHWVLRTD